MGGAATSLYLLADIALAVIGLAMVAGLVFFALVRGRGEDEADRPATLEGGGSHIGGWKER